MTDELIVTVPGHSPRALRHADLNAVVGEHRVDDVGELVPGRRGRAIRFAWIEALAAPSDEARHVEIESTDGGFAATLTREEARAAIVAFADGDRPFGPEDGGPFRLYVPGARDACANVKHLGSVRFAAAPGRDTRPPEEEQDCLIDADG